MMENNYIELIVCIRIFSFGDHIEDSSLWGEIIVTTRSYIDVITLIKQMNFQMSMEII